MTRPRSTPVRSNERDHSIRFGSFSLGDILNKKIQKHRRFAFHGKHTNAETSSRFVEGYVKANIEDSRKEKLVTEEVDHGGSFGGRSASVHRLKMNTLN